MNRDCLFCQIVKGTLPAYTIWEDELALAFLDIFPMAPGHTLIVPKEHSQDYLGLSAHLWQHMGKLAERIAIAHHKEGAEGTNLFMTQGAVAGQTVFHTHWHIVPRQQQDQVKIGECLSPKPSEDSFKSWQKRLAGHLNAQKLQ